MRRARSETIQLGSREWLVRPLTLRQVQAIEPLLFASGETPTGSVASAVAILRVALSRDHAEAVPTLDDIEASAPEIAAAMASALRLGGFLPAILPQMEGYPSSGEAGAGGAPAI